MPKEFVLIIIAFIISLLLIALALAGIDFYFEKSGLILFGTLVKLNGIITLLGGLSMAGLFFLLGYWQENWTGYGHLIKKTPDDSVLTVLNVLISLVILYFLKSFLVSHYGAEFSFPELVILMGFLMLLIPPCLVYLFLRAFGRAFRH